MFPAHGATKWYRYSPNWRVGNDSPMSPLHCPGCSLDAHFKDKGDNKRPLTPMAMQNVNKWQSSGELNRPFSFQGPLPKVGTHSPEGPLPVSISYLFWGSKVSEMGGAEKCPHPRVPLSGTPTAQIGG